MTNEAGLKKFQVSLTRDYVVEIKAQDELDARQFTEFFVTGGLDGSTQVERDHYNFEIERIKPIVNEVFEIEELTDG